MRKISIIAALFIALLASTSYASFIDVSTSPTSLHIDNKDESIIISGTIDEKTNIIIKVVGPLKNYKARRYQQKWGVWSLTKPQIIKDLPTFYQIFASQNIFSSLDVETLRSNMLDPAYFISTWSQTPDEDRITNMLITNSLISKEVLPIEFLGDHFYRAEIQIPKPSADGEYTVQAFGIDPSGAIVNRSDTSFQITHEHQNNPITAFKNKHPILYVASCILIALLVGFSVGSLRNAAKQQ